MSDAHYHLSRLRDEIDETRESMQVEEDAMRYADEAGDHDGYRVAELEFNRLNELLAALTEEATNLETQIRRPA